ncbi:protein adenylyltransferase SelO family protein, partial [Clavibacter michiganensis]|uniref:protein adenylyltransferase SelO family protein n=1 Tax=Clavibacter michiganensis TaxID=28447 RepID=UPI002930CB84
FQSRLVEGFRRKIGLSTMESDDVLLIKALLDTMQRAQADFTLTFRRLSDGAETGYQECRSLFAEPGAIDDWLGRWRQRLAREDGSPADRERRMRAENPLYIPRNHRVEAVIEAAVERDDLGPFEELHAVLAKPFDEQPGRELYTQPPAT